VKLNQQSIIENLIYSPLGVPTLPVELKLTLSDFQTGLLKYWTYAPKHISRNYQITTGSREIVVPMESLYPTVPGSVNPNSDEWFYVGVFGIGTRNQLGQTRFDEYLLGMNYSTPIYDPLQRELANDIIDFNVYVKHF